VSPRLPTPALRTDDEPSDPLTSMAAQAVADMPGASKAAVGRHLHQTRPDLFRTPETARWVVRKAMGAAGDANRRWTGHKHDDVRAKVAQARLPDPERSEWHPYELPTDVKRWLVVGDLQVPYHDVRAIETAVEFGRKANCDGLLLLGDIVDFYQASSFCKDPTRRNMAQEIRDTGQTIAYMRQRLRSPRTIWKFGNHEDRFDRYLYMNAPAFVGLPGFNLPSALQLREQGIDWVDAQNVIHAHKLTILHGHEYGDGKSDPVNPARSMFLKARDCTLSAHQHRVSQHTETTVRDVVVSCWSIGCLCDRHPRYRPVNNWSLGFAILHAGASWKVENYRIIDGEVV